ncbi:MAG: preprotein translocase subunit SecG [Candidatus Omnitrophica bacterium]|nr:preprotein translocase subunit SecG [Candidatus Omnitrophota bacterium]
MMGFIIFVHATICVLLIIIILIQAGRGGGLVEGFSSVESMFGPKTNAFLTRATAILSIMFFCTCLLLAFLSARQSRSLMRNIKPVNMPAQTTAAQETTTAQTVKTQAEPQATAKTEAPKQQTIPVQENTASSPKELPKTE